MFEREDANESQNIKLNESQNIKVNAKNLSNSEVDTLITRIHQYYERLHENDQDQFFDSSKYVDAGKNDAVGRDLNVSRHRYVYSPKYAPLQKKKVIYYPRPMNLERRFEERKVSPGKYRCQSCKKSPLAVSPNSSIKSRSRVIEFVKIKNDEQEMKKYILETLALLGKGNLKRAKEVIEGFVLSKGYQHSDAFFLSGEIDRQLGLYDIAEEKLLRAMTYQVFTPKVFFSLGLIYNEKRDYQKAIRCLKKFLFSIETPEAHFQLGRALMDTNNLNDAAIHLSRAIILDPEEPDYYLLRARCYELQGLQELAQDDYKNVLKIDPTFHLEHVEELRESEELMYTNTVLQKRELLDKMLP